MLALVVGGYARAQPASPGPELSVEVRVGVARSLVGQALAFEHGEGVTKDPEKAAALYCEAARLGDAEALYSLGWMYANGRGLVRNEGFAATLIGMAAEMGHEGAISARRFVSAPPGEQPDCLTAKNALADSRERGGQATGAVSADDVADLDTYVATLPVEKKRIAELVRLLASQYGIHPKFALAIAVAESNLDIMARSQNGAQGVMQLMPETAARFGVTRVFDPGKNIRGGLSYLRWLMSYYRGDVLLVAAAYNAGEGAVDRNGGIPPFLETVGYVKRVLAFFKQPTHPFDASLVQPSPVVSRSSRVAFR